ncbi:MAG: hypothetical protein EBZ69_00945 [Alphaproteobacteria bacterium]|nr:hypothetical protein [Alphaproteobacteria bacterium]NDG03842.1 hypothetical protein [Alphaproteobacteria bacterium]
MDKKAEEANAYYTKQPAKMNVYDAGESVQNMPVKKTEESHKKCSPGEFGMNKEGFMGNEASLRALARAQGATSGQMAGIGYGGLGGGLLGAIYGAYDPGAKATLDAEGNPTLKRRSRLMGALRGSLGGAALGAGVGNFAGHHAGAYLGGRAFDNAQKAGSAHVFGQKVAALLQNK